MKKAAALFIEAVSRYKSIAIYIPGSPDPDAIASAYAIKLILEHLSIDSGIFAEKGLSLPQNQAFIDSLEIPVSFEKEVNLKKYQAYIVPDFQNNRVENISDAIPCAAHLDHHEKSNNKVKADFSLIRTDAGSTSTLVALILMNLNFDFPEKAWTGIATALTFGIQTDTDDFKNIGPLDIQALHFLSAHTDPLILRSLSSMPPAAQTILYYGKAKENQVLYKDWAFYGIGYISAMDRDSIAMAADMLLYNSEHRTVAVFALVENEKKGELYLDVSLRSRSRAVDLNRLVKRITPNGGGRRNKGAYQVKLNYFLNAPDREMLWAVIEATTLEALRRSRDTIYITGMENIYESIKHKVLSLIKKDSESG